MWCAYGNSHDDSAITLAKAVYRDRTIRIRLVSNCGHIHTLYVSCAFEDILRASLDVLRANDASFGSYMTSSPASPVLRIEGLKATYTYCKMR